jgi:hypothetical protein
VSQVIHRTSFFLRRITLRNVVAASCLIVAALEAGCSRRESASHAPAEPTHVAVPATKATDPNLKIAFVGDTDDGSDWKAVASLIKAEHAQAVALAGDMTYSDDPASWWKATESVLGVSYPVFLARGNHDDSSWSGFLPKASEHLGGAERKPGPHDSAYATVFKGLAMATIRKGDAGSVVTELFAGDDHIWKLCLWHQNMERMQVGGKGDEMGWDTYEACRRAGAIIVTGHEHTYHRTRTLTDTERQTVDATCASGSALCVGRGRTYVSVVGLGGKSIRDQKRCKPVATTPPFPSLNTTDESCPIWASIYTSDQNAKYGAQFLIFNVDGNPKKARGYFKNIANEIIDQFEVTAD